MRKCPLEKESPLSHCLSDCIVERLHQLNRKLNSKDDSRLEGDQKMDSRSPQIRKLVRLQCMPMERKVTKSDPYDHNKELPIRLLKQECCQDPKRKSFLSPNLR